MSTTYYPVIGLEIHAELNTTSKMFCGCKNDPNEEKPNTNICPICMAHPGTLPVPNSEAVLSVVRVGLALDAIIADFTEFDRKHYFYPDIPKGYQISQYKYPIVSGGSLHGVKITRIHLEEDTGNSKHDKGAYTHVDYNRAGVPLMELVTEPVITSAKEAGDFARELQLLLRYLHVSEANMEKGEMRVEANISVSNDKNVWGTKVEVKNLNSFKAVEKAIDYELARMISLIEAGRKDEIVQETRGWDEGTQKTFSQRSKENAQDYRYFPDPDINKLKLHSLYDLEMLKAALPELPWQKRDRYLSIGLKSDDVEVYLQDNALAEYFEGVVKDKNESFVKTASNYLISDALGLIKKDPSLKLPHTLHYQELIGMVMENEITSRGAKDILAIIMQSSASPKEIAQSRNLLQQNSEEVLEPVVLEVISEHQKMVEEYKSGKEAVLQALVGMVMKKTKGAANPTLAAQMLKNRIV